MELPGDVEYDYVVRGLSMAAIAKEYGCSTYPIFTALHAAGVKSRRFEDYSPEYKRRLAHRCREIHRFHFVEGYSRAELAQSYGYSLPAIDKIIQRVERGQLDEDSIS